MTVTECREFDTDTVIALTPPDSSRFSTVLHCSPLSREACVDLKRTGRGARFYPETRLRIKSDDERRRFTDAGVKSNGVCADSRAKHADAAHPRRWELRGGRGCRSAIDDQRCQNRSCFASFHLARERIIFLDFAIDVSHWCLSNHTG